MGEIDHVEQEGMNVVAAITVTTDDLKEYHFKAKLKKMTNSLLKCRFEDQQRHNYLEYYENMVAEILEIRLEHRGNIIKNMKAKLIAAKVEFDGNFEDIVLYFQTAEDQKLYEHVTELSFKEIL